MIFRNNDALEGRQRGQDALPEEVQSKLEDWYGETPWELLLAWQGEYETFYVNIFCEGRVQFVRLWKMSGYSKPAHYALSVDGEYRLPGRS